MESKKYKLSAIVFYSVILALALVLPKMAFASPVPDSGQTKCYNNTVDIPCPQPGEPFYGQDAQYGTNTQSYTDLGNGIVRDNVTGLEWQQLHPPAQIPPGGIEGYWREANDFCNNLSLGGKDDWRLPTIKELSTLVDNGIPYPGPTINTSFFPDTIASYYGYWSSSLFMASGNPMSDAIAWEVTFDRGLVTYGSQNIDRLPFRAVRGGQSSNSFVDNSDSTISDTSTGLMWQKATAPGTYTWEEALTYCENLTLADKSDWRLPNRNELQSIVNYNTHNPVIDTTFFPGTVASGYWSSTTNASNTNGAWYVNFDIGLANSYDKSDGNYVRAVRDVGSSGTMTTTTTVSGTNTTTTTTASPVSTTTIPDIACTTNITCGNEAYYCDKSVGDCAGSGQCKEKPNLKTCDYYPHKSVIGCDEKTYWNSCSAAANGVCIDYYEELAEGPPKVLDIIYGYWVFTLKNTKYPDNVYSPLRYDMHSSGKTDSGVYYILGDSLEEDGEVFSKNSVACSFDVKEEKYVLAATAGLYNQNLFDYHFTVKDNTAEGTWKLKFSDSGEYDYGTFIGIKTEKPNKRICPATYLLKSQNNQIRTLRQFRDEVLMKNAIGRHLVDIYYTKGDKIINLLDTNPILNKSATVILKLIIPLIENWPNKK